jgi:proteasome lid subunit RPN8/RPN11
MREPRGVDGQNDQVGRSAKRVGFGHAVRHGQLKLIAYDTAGSRTFEKGMTMTDQTSVDEVSCRADYRSWNTSSAIVSGEGNCCAAEAVQMPEEVLTRILDQAERVHRAGLKAFGLLLAEPAAPRHPYHPTDVVFLNPRTNHRNDPGIRDAFEAQGRYFREFDDAGFVADPTELLHVCRAIEDSGREIVAPFHIHRRQPANFSLIDYRLHNPAFAWHLIVSLRDPRRPAVQPFRVRKQPDDFGITEHDHLESSELAYDGPEVYPISLIVQGSP